MIAKMLIQIRIMPAFKRRVEESFILRPN